MSSLSKYQLSLQDLEAAAQLVYQVLPPTPQYSWPLLKTRFQTEVWVKHENHLPVGAFKVRGGLTYLHALLHEEPWVEGVVAATRGNHGQSIALAAKLLDLEARIVVPFGNSAEKNRAMQALGAELIEYGQDFQEAAEYARYLADQLRFHFVPSFHPDLVKGVATYAWEFFKNAPELDVVYVPVGQGSGLVGVSLVRDLLGLKTEVVGVVAAAAPAYATSMQQGELLAMDVGPTIADGLACRKPHPEAFALMQARGIRFVKVSEPEIKRAMQVLFADTHNVAEGSAAASLAAYMQEQDKYRGGKVGVILSGGNIDSHAFAEALLEQHN